MCLAVRQMEVCHANDYNFLKEGGGQIAIAPDGYLPKKCEKGSGRKKGEKQVKRVEYKVEKKAKAVKPRKRKSEKIE